MLLLALIYNDNITVCMLKTPTTSSHFSICYLEKNFPHLPLLEFSVFDNLNLPP